MKHATAEHLSVSRETRERLQAYAALLLRWQGTVNLISRGDVEHIWTRHIQDSLQLIELMPASVDRAIDLGSGAGFPGLVMAIATDIPFDLIEADQRKSAFLREAARITAAPVTVNQVRIEHARVRPAPLITARALAPLGTLLELAAPLLAPRGICIFPKGRGAEHELTAAGAKWQMHITRTQSRTDPSATILRLSEIAPVPPRP